MNRMVWVGLALTGCWKLERTALENERIPFAPEAQSIDGVVDIDDWVVEERVVDLDCPDGQPARFLFVHPQTPSGPLPTAVIAHSGPFDFIGNPSPSNPLQGVHFAEPSRLESAWGVRMGYATLGMVPAPLQGEEHRGALPAALASQGVAMILPINCWGDWWHNGAGVADNVFEADFFFRSGRTAVTWAFRAAEEPGFADAIDLTLPFEPDPSAVFFVGLGEGGRALGELLHTDLDADGLPDHRPKAAVVDSLIDDLSTLSLVQPATEAGLSRLFPTGDFDAGALGTAPQLPPTFFAYSPVDAAVPSGSQDRLLALLESDPRHHIATSPLPLHVLTNDNVELATEAVDFLLAQ